MTSKILVYGSYGYTGEIIARLAKEEGVEITLSGRNVDKLEAQSAEVGFDTIPLDLNDSAALVDTLSKFDVVIHCAGPFAHTYEVMVNACIKAKTHYTDITGEGSVFEGLWMMDDVAKAAGVMLLPGTGFDIVPSDCLAAHLKSRCPDATHLELAFCGVGGGVSHGTAMTMVENFASGGQVRENGVLKQVPTVYKTRDIDFAEGTRRHCMTIPWGDVVTAYKSTGIGNVLVYTATPKKATTWLKRLRPLLPIIGFGPIQNMIKKRIDAAPAGPSDKARAESHTLLWGEAKNAAGDTFVSRLRTPEGYTLTVKMALRIAQKVAGGEYKAGFQTPSTAYGKDLVLELEGTSRSDEG